jgi:hypothetical protein
MPLTPSSLPEPGTEGVEKPPGRMVLAKILRSRWLFAGLQVLDLLTTLAAFHVGAFEMNPLVAQLALRFGQFRGVVISKFITVAIAMGVQRLIWVVNIFYTGVVCWNVIVLIVLSLKPH